MVRNVAVICKPGTAPLEVLKELVPWLKQRGKKPLLEPETAHSLGIDRRGGAEVVSQAEIALVLGGDGTMLRAARLFAGRKVPLLGVNIGGMGFITEVTKKEMYDALAMIFDGGCPSEERIMLSACVRRAGERTVEFTVLNDVVINKGNLARAIDIETSINGSYVNVFKADGLIVCTPTGSTAYSLSAGGPIIFPTLECIVLTPICPHTLTNRPIVLSQEAVIELRLLSDTDGVLLTLDGQTGHTLIKDDVVEVRKSPHKTTLLIPSRRDHFQVLRAKLRWGER